ncbi:nuclease [Nitrospirillum viridazoti Y2]|uniref:ParB family chromosome partitioning protein n=1 Tax=Nitrospirillum amazonense TaxID=28077 RepID=A0A560HKE5_9PROT|nr:ParB/RepB/Spo0J family partition protein [Nitrospirillum amazonense]EGY02475.1 nuclease [Nitrospirillum amazonense Y2]TWB46973.1 ParB family chromosome partitioning protein [Nitrospirillum amazonense]
MTATPAKIILSRSQDIPFNKLVLSQANVRRVKAGVSIVDLAEDIARRTLLQSLSVRAQQDAEGNETGLYEVPTGGRRFRALELLVKQKRLAKTAPIPCVIRTEGLGEEDSLAENTQREALHPLDQFRAFHTLREKGLDEEEIAARFFVTPAVVKQRLRLASVSPRLLDLYAEDGITLEQLMAFSVSDNHDHQEQVWAAAQTWQREPFHIRRALTASSVPAQDKRARFVGLDAYVAAGGPVMRDLFTPDEGGWLCDVPLLDRLVAEKLASAAEAVAEEGWKWIETDLDFSYGHTAGLRRLMAEEVPMTDAEQARRDELHALHERLLEIYDSPEAPQEGIDQQLSDIEDEMARLDDRPRRFEADEMARAGCFVSISPDGVLRVDRGFVRPEDEPKPEPVEEAESAADGDDDHMATISALPAAVDADETITQDPEAEEDGLKPLPERLVMELTAYRTLALRDALAQDSDTAFIAVLHVLCLQTFYSRSTDSCLQIMARSPSFMIQPPGLADSAPAQSIQARQQTWAAQLPQDAGDLWGVLVGFDADSTAALFAHCAALTLHAVLSSVEHSPAFRRNADRLANVLQLDLASVGWAPTAANYLGRVTKARILEAVTEAKGDAAARRIDYLRKPDMVEQAEQLLAGTGWLPVPLRSPGQVFDTPYPSGDAPDQMSEGQETEGPQPVAAE